MPAQHTDVIKIIRRHISKPLSSTTTACWLDLAGETTVLCSQSLGPVFKRFDGSETLIQRFDWSNSGGMNTHAELHFSFYFSCHFQLFVSQKHAITNVNGKNNITQM